MLFEFDEQCVVSRPTPEGTHERGQQHIVNECVINRRHVLQKSVRLINRKRTANMRAVLSVFAP